MSKKIFLISGIILFFLLAGCRQGEDSSGKTRQSAGESQKKEVVDERETAPAKIALPKDDPSKAGL